MNCRFSRAGLTAIEVLASTLLSALLMAALIGVLRGLKAHEQALDSRDGRPPWQQSLDAALAADLAGAEHYQASPKSLTLHGHGDRNPNGQATWLPAVVCYEVREGRSSTWLVRRELPAAGGTPPQSDSLVLEGVTELRIMTSTTPPPVDPGPQTAAEIQATPSGQVEPLPSSFVVEFWRAGETKPRYRYRHRTL